MDAVQDPLHYSQVPPEVPGPLAQRFSAASFLPAEYTHTIRERETKREKIHMFNISLIRYAYVVSLLLKQDSGS